MKLCKSTIDYFERWLSECATDIIDPEKFSDNLVTLRECMTVVAMGLASAGYDVKYVVTDDGFEEELGFYDAKTQRIIATITPKESS